MAAVARNIITEEDLAADTKQSISMDNFSSLYTNSPIIRAYTAVMTPASVGVNLPLLNPTKMNTGRSRAQNPSVRDFTTCLRLCLGAVGSLSFLATKNHKMHSEADR